MNSAQKPVAIVTGASSGIGLGLTLTVIKQGHDVAGTSLSTSKSKELNASSDLVLIDGDISKKETTVQVAAAAINRDSREGTKAQISPSLRWHGTSINSGT